MTSIWHVMSFEYVRHVFRKRFLFGLLSLPLFLGAMALVVLLLVRSEINLDPIGYVDDSGLLTDPGSLTGQDFQGSWVKLIAFDSQDEAQAALQAEQIQAYYVLESDYLETRQAKLIALEAPSGIATGRFSQLVRANLLANLPSEVVTRLTQGNQLIVRSSDGTRQFIRGDWWGFLLPFMVGFIFLIAVFATSGYLLQAVVEEKENQTMELLVTSISQLIVWFGLALILLLFVNVFLDITDWVSVSLDYIALAVVLFVLGFIMLSALMVAVGATLADVQEAQQVTSLFTLPLFLPFWFAFQIINHPNGPVAVGLSIFPFTAPIALAIRTGFASIPGWQIGLSLGLLIISAAFAVWFAGRAFRLGMLRYGQRVSWREFLGFRVEGKLE